MSDHIQEALEHLEALSAFAYKSGFHELGCDPIHLLRQELLKAERENADLRAVLERERDAHMEFEDELRQKNIRLRAALEEISNTSDREGVEMKALASSALKGKP